MSRHVPEKDTIDLLLEDIPTISMVAKSTDEEDNVLEWNVDKLPAEQDKVTLYKQIKEYIAGTRKEVPKYLTAPIENFCVETGILYLKNENNYEKIRYRACLPQGYVQMALRLAHDIPISGHSGIAGTIERLRSFAYWPNINSDVKKFVRTCKVCLKTKIGRSKAPILRNPEVQRPWDRVNMDLIGPLNVSNDGNKYILTIIDVLTRYAVAVAIADKSASTVARALINHVFAVFGPPRSIYSDQGKEFVAQLTADVIKSFNVRQRTITIYRPQASGLVERYNSHLISILRALVHEHQDSWDMSLPLAMLAHNTSYHRVLRETPYFLMFLRDPNVPYSSLLKAPSPWYNVDSLKHELLRRAQTSFIIARKFIEEGKEIQEKYANKKAKTVNYRLGDRVYVQKKINITKLGSKYVGPYRVVKILGVILWVKDLHSFKIYRVHVDRLKLELSVCESESVEAQAAFPTGNDTLDREYEQVSEVELKESGLKESNVPRTNAETFLAQDLGITNKELNSVQDEAVVNEEVDLAMQAYNDIEDGQLSASRALVEPVAQSVDTDVPTASEGYPLRSRGVNVQSNEWVQNRTLEYKINSEKNKV